MAIKNKNRPYDFTLPIKDRISNIVLNHSHDLSIEDQYELKRLLMSIYLQYRKTNSSWQETLESHKINYMCLDMSLFNMVLINLCIFIKSWVDDVEIYPILE